MAPSARTSSPGSPTCSPSPSASAAMQLRQAIDAVHDHGPFPAQVVQTHVLELDPVGRHAEPLGHVALDVDRDVAQADRPMPGVDQGLADDPDGVREVDDPGVSGAAPCGELGELQDDGHGSERLREATRARSSPGR